MRKVRKLDDNKKYFLYLRYSKEWYVFMLNNNDTMLKKGNYITILDSGEKSFKKHESAILHESILNNHTFWEVNNDDEVEKLKVLCSI